MACAALRRRGAIDIWDCYIKLTPHRGGSTIFIMGGGGGGGEGRKRLCASTHITSTEPNSFSAGVQGPLEGSGSSKFGFMLSCAFLALFLSILKKKIDKKANPQLIQCWGGGAHPWIRRSCHTRRLCGNHYISRVSSQNGLTPFWSIWDIWDLSCWNIKKIIRKCVILLIITSKIFLYIQCVPIKRNPERAVICPLNLNYF